MRKFLKSQMKWRTVAVLSGISLTACALSAFKYKYYTYDMGAHKLLGAEPKDDLDDSICLGDAEASTPCVVIKNSEFKKLKADYEKLEIELDSCQRN